MEKLFSSLLTGVLLSGLLSCSFGNRTSAGAANEGSEDSVKTLVLGEFSADSAYMFIEKQVAFGPRVPGTPEHEACADYLISELKRLGVDTMYVQKGEVTAFDGTVLPITNIIASFCPQNLRRILLVAHWDTRPWADNETSAENRAKPVLGANDGASGVGVLLEIARNLAAHKPNVGVDILFVDAEDYGDNYGFNEKKETWCLGTQYWTKHMKPYSIDNLPVYGILLDMVGGKDARFHYEHFSKENAAGITFKLWSEAKLLKHDDVFVRAMGGAVTDDHLFLTDAGIPTTDVIETVNQETGSFPPTWHTLNDNMDNISKHTLKAVGETVLNVIYKEKAY